MNWDIILRVAGVLGGLAVLVLPWQIRKVKAETRKTSADAAAILTEHALKMLEPAQAQAKDLFDQLKATRARVRRLEEDLKASQAEVQDLRTQVAAMTKEVVELRAENDVLRGGAG